MEKHYRKCNTLLRPIVTSILLVASLNLNAQSVETIEITPELSDHLKENYARIFTLTTEKIDSPERTAYLINQDFPIENFKGTYIVEPEKYKWARSDYKGNFVASELVNVNKKYEFGLSERTYTVVRKDGSDELLALSDDITDGIEKFNSLKKMSEVIHKLGYKEYKDGQDYYFKSKTSEIRMDARTFKEMQKNPNYIPTLDADQIKLYELGKQTIPHSQTLDKYLSQYRIQRSKMPTASLNAWRTTTTNAQKMLTQINKIAEKYEGNYSFTPLKKSSAIDIFLDNLNASKGVLGM